MADPHVLVHHSLTGLLREEIPIRALRERVDDEVARTLAVEERLLLVRWLPDVLRRTDPADQRVTKGQPGAEPGPKERGGCALERFDRWRHAPEQQVDAGLETDRGVADAADAAKLGDRGGGTEETTVLEALPVRPTPPCRIDPEGESLDVDLLVGGHRSSRSHVARSAAA